jgi:hypothetical protein
MNFEETLKNINENCEIILNFKEMHFITIIPINPIRNIYVTKETL